MHPMFVKLFIETDADDLLAEEEEDQAAPRAPVRTQSAGHSREGRRP